MKIKTNMRHFPDSSAMTQEDINTYLNKKFKFMLRYTNEDDVLDFKIKKKNPRITAETKFPKSVYEVRVKGKLKTGQEVFYTKESVDLKTAIDLLVNTAKEDVVEKVKEKQQKPKGYRAAQREATLEAN